MAVPIRGGSSDGPEKSVSQTSSASSSGKHRESEDHKSGKSQRNRNFFKGLIEFVIIIVLALSIATLIRVFIVQPFYVPSGSMEQTLQINDRVIASKISTTISGVSRGEIMVFKDPGGWLPMPVETDDSGLRGAFKTALTFVGLLPSDSGDDLVKRVIAVEGDQIACCDDQGHIVLNGVSLDESSYINGPTDQVLFDVTVPPGGMFVMGDNRGNSADSRFHLDQNKGAVPVTDAVGRVVMVVWPFSRLSTEPIPEIFGNPALSVNQ